MTTGRWIVTLTDEKYSSEPHPSLRKFNPKALFSVFSDFFAHFLGLHLNDLQKKTSDKIRVIQNNS